MKKFGKFLTSLVVIGGVAAGAFAVYKKFFASDDLEDDFDEDFEDEFEDGEEGEEETSKREYVSLNPTPADGESEDGVSAEAIAEKEAAMAEDETAKAEEAKEETEE